MARNKNRHFSESDGLGAQDFGANYPDADERLPAWAQQREEARRESARQPESPAEEEADREKAPEPEEDDMPSPPPETKREAEEAWAREATRVESGTYRRNPAPHPEKGKDGDGKKKTRRKKRKTKNTSQAEERRSFLRLMVTVLVCGVLFLMVGMMVLSSFIPGLAILSVPRKFVTGLLAPVQTVFAQVTESVADYLRTLKIRSNLEYEYEQALLKIEELSNDNALLEEYKHEIGLLKDQLTEQEENKNLNGISARVIGTTGNNYFSTLTLNVGSANGVGDYMAVVSNGGLVGVTYNTRETTCSVRCIIDSDCTVAGVVQTSRDQGSVKGTLGTNGEPMCRMYYLPDNSLPRPNDRVDTSGVGLEFPRGIPIGYIRESTRSMDDNKSYVVVEPIVDFQHLEYVTVYRFVPDSAESAQTRGGASQQIALEPLVTARPAPTFAMEGVSDFMYAATGTPTAEQTPGPADQTEATPTPDPSASAVPTATPGPGSVEYHVPDFSGATPTPSPRPTNTPTPTPAPTSDAGAMTVEDDE